MSNDLNNDYPIDFVVTWVDGSDDIWRREMKEALNKISEGNGKKNNTKDDDDVRFRDWELLKYWFRGVERFAPWVRKVWFITYGHLPEFLNTDHKKLEIVRHDSYIPEEYLPTFNSNTIELNMNRIEGLSEHFVYFNDDVHLIAPVKKSDFFRNAVPADMLCFQPDVANESDEFMPYIYLNNAMVLARHFSKRECVKKSPGDYFSIRYPLKNIIYNALELSFPRYTGFYTPHGPAPFMKHTFDTLWDLEGEVLHRSCLNTFRSREDVNQYLVREYQKLTGEFTPFNSSGMLEYCNLSDDNEKICRIITRQKKKIVCLNDSAHINDFQRAASELKTAFEKILPDKCSFEK